jgi:hypothetical protein
MYPVCINVSFPPLLYTIRIRNAVRRVKGGQVQYLYKDGYEWFCLVRNAIKRAPSI